MSTTPPSNALRPLLQASLVIALLLPMSCGTIFFSERQGQKSGKVDPNILILDGVGLLFFIIPGLVAFGVDFITGAIYLPPDVERGEGPFIRDDAEKGAEPKPSDEAAPEAESTAPEQKED